MEENILCTTTTSDYDCPPPTVTPEDIARGWQLVEVKTNCNISYTMPEGATLASNWWVRGAYEDVKWFGWGAALANASRGEISTGEATAKRPLGSCDGTEEQWRFPFGTNEYSSLWAFSWGKVRFALADTNAEIIAVGVPMSAHLAFAPCRRS